MAPIRRALAFPTIFNVLGPLINPAQPRRCVLGVHSYNLGRTYAEALKRRGNIERAWVVCGREGLDEISCEGPTDVWELDAQGEIKEFTVEPLRDFGINPHPLKHVGSYSSDENASIVLRLLSSNEASLSEGSLDKPLDLSEEDLHPSGGSAARSDGAHLNGQYAHEKKPYPPIPAGAHLRAIADYTLIQSAALLHVAGKSSSLKKCVELARESMRSGSARRALETFRKEAAAEIRKVEEASEARRRQEQAQADMERRKRQASSDALNRDSRAELQDSFSYFPNPSRDANVGTED
jgi:anthranilate phosphoribosyltransferase